MQTRRLALVGIALIASIGLTGAASAETPEGLPAAGLSGHTITFRVTSPDVDQACVAYYETTEKGGPALHPPVDITLTTLPFKASVDVGSKVRHWHITAYAAEDCAATDPPKGIVKCQLRVDGKLKAKAKGKDQLVFCFV